jgi:predicted metal-dependent hydrolase
MDISYKSSEKARHVRITVKKDKVIVTVPKKVSVAYAQSFVEKNMDWIQRKLYEAEKKHKKNKIIYQFGTEYKTKLTIVKILESNSDKCFVKQDKIQLGIYLPNNIKIEDEVWQELIKSQIEEQLKREAKFYLVKRTVELASIKQINIGKVTIRKTTSRWGSCSAKNDISLSAYCMTLPDELIDYIICHELAHVKEKNHSKSFWDHLEILLPGAKKLDKEMNKYSTSID